MVTKNVHLYIQRQYNYIFGISVSHKISCMPIAIYISWDTQPTVTIYSVPPFLPLPSVPSERVLYIYTHFLIGNDNTMNFN
jgi:hypothetical protein